MSKQKQEIIFGIRAVIEAINKEMEIEKILLKKGSRGELFNELFKLIRDKEIPFQYVPIEKINSEAKGNHQGAMAYISPVAYADINEIVEEKLARGEKPVILLLDRITDVRNFGGIARTAECAGIDVIIIPIKHSAKINPDSIKTSAGALHTIPVCKVKNLKRVAKDLKYQGFKIIAATEKADTYYYDADFTEPTVIIMGAEDTGIAEDLLNITTDQVKIPIKGKIESLNVSVAASIFMYEVVKQRM